MKCPFVIKVCTKCNRILVANSKNFHKSKNCKYGLNSVCIICEKKYKNNYYKNNKEHINKKNKENYNKNKEDILIKSHEYYKKNKEHIKERVSKYNKNNNDKIKERQKEYRKNNKNKLDKKHKEWYDENKEYVLEYQKEYRKNNPHVKINSHNKRRLLKENQRGEITKEQWLEMMEFFDWRCAYSDIILSKETRSVDHIVPLNNGGEHEIWNLVPMYKNYNCKKNTSNMEDWYMQQEFFDIDRLLKIYEWIEYAWNKWNK